MLKNISPLKSFGKNYPVLFLFVIIFFLITGCNNTQKDKIDKKKTTSEVDNQITLKENISPFKKAQELKNEYYYEYPKIMEELKKDFPEKEIILTESEKKQLFPEQMIGENFPCHAIQTASFYKKDFDSTEIEGNLEKGTDKLSIKINGDDTISFLTAAAFELGELGGNETKDDIWNIIVNDNYTLVAQNIWKNNAFSILTISKETGLGIWQKTTAIGFYDVPSGLMIYLQCSLPLDIENNLRNL